MRFVDFFMALITWFRFVLSFAGLALIIALPIYLNFKTPTGEGISIALFSLISLGGVLWSTKQWLEKGSADFWTPFWQI